MSSQESFTVKASSQPAVGSIIPHLLLPCANVLALASPPFRGRGLLWSVVIASLAYLSLFDKYPNDTQIRYGLSCIWVFYLWTLGMLLFTHPELTYWRLDRPRAEAASIPFGFRKLQWAAALWINPRGIGWNHQVKGVRLAKEPSSKWWFVLQQCSWLLVCYIAVVFMTGYLSRHPYSGDRDSMTLMRRVITELDMAIMISFGWKMQWTMVSIVGVATGLSQPRDWPPLFGRLKDTTTVRNFWGSLWHQILRKPLSNFSYAISNILGIRRGSHLSYLVDLSISFSISAFFHALTLVPLPSSLSSYDIFRGILPFFMSQVVAILTEELVMECYRRFTTPMQKPAGQDPRAEVAIWKILVGYIWVLSWLLSSAKWAVEVYLQMHMWEIPETFVTPLVWFSAEHSQRGSCTVLRWVGSFDTWVDGR